MKQISTAIDEETYTTLNALKKLWNTNLPDTLSRAILEAYKAEMLKRKVNVESL